MEKPITFLNTFNNCLILTSKQDDIIQHVTSLFIHKKNNTLRTDTLSILKDIPTTRKTQHTVAGTQLSLKHKILSNFEIVILNLLTEQEYERNPPKRRGIWWKK